MLNACMLQAPGILALNILHCLVRKRVIDTVLQRNKLKSREIRYLGQSHRAAEFNPRCVGLTNLCS